MFLNYKCRAKNQEGKNINVGQKIKKVKTKSRITGFSFKGRFYLVIFS